MAYLPTFSINVGKYALHGLYGKGSRSHRKKRFRDLGDASCFSVAKEHSVFLSLGRGQAVDEAACVRRWESGERSLLGCQWLVNTYFGGDETIQIHGKFEGFPL